jgi:hypothetical protein
MADNKWIGAANAVIQVGTFQVTAVSGTPSDTEYFITIGGDAVSVVGDTDVNTTAAALQVALEASTNPYFSGITWTVATDTISCTAQVAALPFTAVSSDVGGTGTIGAYSATTAATGPNHWDNARNWSVAVPVSTDNVIIENSAISITHGLDQASVTLASLKIKKSFTGRIGLRANAFSSTASGNTTNAAKNEYKEKYLKIGATLLDIGEDETTRPQNGSTLVKINIGTIASTITVHGTASTSYEESKPAVQLLGVNVGNNLFVRSAKASVGIAVSAFEVSTFNDIDIASGMDSGGVVLGSGVTFLNWTQKSGDNYLNGAATVTSVSIYGGTLESNGDLTLTLVTVGEGAVYYPNHQKTAGVEITTLTYTNAATVDTTRSVAARTITTVNLAQGAELVTDTNFVTITNLTPPNSDYSLSITE